MTVTASPRPATEIIHEDEKAWSLREIHLVRPPTNQWRRFQIITVNRDDVLTEWWHDLGPMSAFNRPQIEIPSLWEHSVAELREMADTMRLEESRWKNRAAELAAESSLIPDMLNQFEEGKKIMANQSVFGPAVTHQRNGLDRRAFNERIRRRD